MWCDKLTRTVSRPPARATVWVGLDLVRAGVSVAHTRQATQRYNPRTIPGAVSPFRLGWAGVLETSPSRPSTVAQNAGWVACFWVFLSKTAAAIR